MNRLLIIAAFLGIVLAGCKEKEKEDPTYIVTFDSKGGSAVESQTVKRGGKIVEPKDPTRSEHAFDAWYKETALTNKWNFANDIVTADITLYAKWIEDGNGGEECEVCEEDKPIILTPREQDSLALVALYNSTNGDNWTNKTGWKTAPLEYWHGIEIANNRVTQINLMDNNLTGSIPSEIYNLSQLKNLWLWSNQLTGSISDEIGNLSQLQFLALADNALTGSIPATIGNLSQLQQIELGDNHLTGSIPSEIGNINQLQSLGLYNNQLSGAVSDVILGWVQSNPDLFVICPQQGSGFSNYTCSIPDVTLVSIAVTTQPIKKTYIVGEAFDPTGMVVTATYSDNTTAPVMVDASNFTYDFSTAGSKIVTIAYQGETATVTVTINTETPPITETITMISWFGNVQFQLAGVGQITINWGDGITQTHTLSYDYLEYSHNYLSGTNHIITITISGSGYIRGLICYNNQLTSLDVSKITYLQYLVCYNNQLTSLDVSKNIYLEQLVCDNNQLASLDVSKNIDLMQLICNNNELKNLDVSSNTKLETLRCSNNELTSLNVSGLTALVSLNCGNNQLKNLDLNSNTKLQSLDVSNNQLTSLDVSKTDIYSFVKCQSNQLTTTALNNLFETLPYVWPPNSRTIYIYNNHGTNTCDQSIATKKYWAVNTTQEN